MKVEEIRNLMTVAGVTASSASVAIMVHAQILGVSNDQTVAFGAIAIAGILLAIIGSESYR